ncbi:hypothetical protein OCT51_00730 [Halomonas sp. LR3S48]|uniref:hypothetical protein n=1 Tax=Halomonas sp. LR3S48 TaxID=2982694 RepID=UPI0021E3F3AC|nr:hypothetical protein [Halomonas sp. LR3S48]UYG03915.1 hypothetical protein OCT51_00730 [Halomonas sp. LR3S48]
MWFIQPKKNYVPEMLWERINEPEVMSWQVRVRDYNTFVANILLFVISLLSGGVWFSFAYSFLEMSEIMSMVCVGMFFLMTPVFMSMTHQTSIIVYRLTDKGYEKISWKPQIDSVKPVMKWTAIISGVAVLVATFFNPNFLYGMVGPAGFGLLALTMGNSGSYQSLVRGERHENRSWDAVEEIVLWKKRRLVGVKMSFDDGYGPHSSYQKIYCEKGCVEKVLDFIKSKAPDVDFLERKLIVNEISAQ